MICVVDASVAVKWFAQGDWALREDDIEPALEILKASTRGTLDFYQPPHFLAEVAAVVSRLKPDRAQLGIPVDRDRSFRFVVTGDSGLS